MISMAQGNFCFKALLGRFLNIICEVCELQSGINESKDTMHIKREYINRSKELEGRDHCKELKTNKSIWEGIHK